MRGLLLLLLALLTCTPALGAETGIFPVGSTYEKGRGGTGTGFSVTYKDKKGKDRLFLITCAHLTGGANVKIGGRAMTEISLGRRTDAFHDIDIIELDPKKVKGPAFASVVPPTPGEKQFWRQLYDESKAQASGKAPYRDPYGNIMANEKLLRSWTGQQLLISAGAGFDSHSLIPPWAAKGEEEGNWKGRGKDWEQGKNYPNQSEFLYSDLISGTLHAQARIAPGMSCSPLLGKNLPSQAKRIFGMGIEFKNDLADSTFATANSILRNLYAFADGEEHERIPATWKTQNGMLYLQLDERGAEIIPARIAGNGDVTPTNGHSTSPSGHSTPPNGHSVPPSGHSTPPGKNSNPNACSAYEPSISGWEKIGSLPAVQWDGKAVMGFKLQFAGAAQPFLVFPDRAGMKLRILAEKHGVKTEDITLGSDILSWFDRVQFASKKKFGNSYFARSRAEGMETKGPEVERHPDHLLIRIYGPPPERETIEFKLDRHGALMGTGQKPYFQPVIEVKGPSGRFYTVDLMSFFHSNARHAVDPDYSSAAQFLVERAWAGDPTLKNFDLISGAAKGLSDVPLPEISYRPKCSSKEYHFYLSELAPLPSQESGISHTPDPKDLSAE